MIGTWQLFSTKTLIVLCYTDANVRSEHFYFYLCKHRAARCQWEEQMSGLVWSTRQPSQTEVPTQPAAADWWQNPHLQGQKWPVSAACTSPLWTPGYWKKEEVTFPSQHCVRTNTWQKPVQSCFKNVFKSSRFDLKRCTTVSKPMLTPQTLHQGLAADCIVACNKALKE